MLLAELDSGIGSRACCTVVGALVGGVVVVLLDTQTPASGALGTVIHSFMHSFIYLAGGAPMVSCPGSLLLCLC